MVSPVNLYHWEIKNFFYEASLNDLSAAAQSATIHKMIFENLPPFKLEVLAARALRAKMFSRILSFDVLTQMNEMLEDPPQISSNAWDALWICSCWLCL